MGEEDRGGLLNPDPDLSKNRGGLPDPDLDPTRFLSRYYPPRDISPISGQHCDYKILICLNVEIGQNNQESSYYLERYTYKI